MGGSATVSRLVVEEQLDLFSALQASFVAPAIELAVAECSRCRGNGAYYDGMRNGGRWAIQCECGAQVAKHLKRRIEPKGVYYERIRAERLAASDARSRFSYLRIDEDRGWTRHKLASVRRVISIEREPREPRFLIGDCGWRGQYLIDDMHAAGRRPTPFRGSVHHITIKRFVFSPSPKPAKKKKQPKPTDIACCNCGITWAQASVEPDWMWIDEGIIGINECVRCGRNACHKCYARYPDSDSWGVLCAECFDLPQLTNEELEVHPDYEAHGPRFILAEMAWRYAEPTGQICEINPATIWFWQQREYDTDAKTQPKKEKIEHNRRWKVVNGQKPVADADASWLAPGVFAFLKTPRPKLAGDDEFDDEDED
jgi:hypothetical protein